MASAHPGLPKGTKANVNDLEDGKVEVRINSRGPFAENRLIDLFHASAKQLGIK
jgi:rare lipoprotein A